jgi:hypothetical protein
MYPEITWRASWVLDQERTVCNNTAYFLESADAWIVAVANAPISWWYSWRKAVHGKDEALRFIKDFVHDFPVPSPSQAQRECCQKAVPRLIAITREQYATRRTILDWLGAEYEVEKPTLRLQSPFDLDSDSFIGEIKKVRGKKRPLSAAALKNLRDEYARSVEPARALMAEALRLENEISHLVNTAYGLTPEELALMWQTAPPRMPIPRPR